MDLAPARIAPAGRRGAQPTSRTRTFQPPLIGLSTSTPLVQAQPGSAHILDNFRTTRRGIAPRGGSVWRVSAASGNITSLFQYTAAGGEVYYAATAAAVYPFDDADPDETVLAADISGQSGGNYSAVENTTSGGQYLTIVNGADSAQIYNGTAWQQVTDVSTPLAITGVATASLSYVWLYRGREFFIESGTLSAWYLGTDAVAGAATELPLTGVFRRGGGLLFGATISSDSGAGFDDRCVFVTSEGEIAVYSGGDPSDPNDWALNGVYEIGKPLGRHAHVNVGGDLLIGTTVGLIPLSAAMRGDTAQLAEVAVSRRIEGDWQAEVLAGGSALDWKIVKRDETNEIYVAPSPLPSPTPFVWVMNAGSGAWYRFTGWQASAVAVLGDSLHFAGGNAKVLKGDVGGTDAGAAFVCQAALAFEELDAFGALKLIQSIRARWLYQLPINPKHSVSIDYLPDMPSAPSVAPTVTEGASLWDVALWDVALWSNEDVPNKYQAFWEAQGRHCRAASIQVQLTSGASYTLRCELVALDLAYSTGAVYA